MRRPVAHLAAALAATAALALGGCGSLKHAARPAEITPDAAQLLSRLSLQNDALTTFKGTGTVRLNTGEGSRRTARVAWIGEAPDKLRLAVLNIGGLPATTMAADGNYFFMATQAPRKFYKTRTSDPSLDRLIGIHLKTREIIQILRGRVPMREFHRAEAAVDVRTGDMVLTLSDGRGRMLERIRFSGELPPPKSVEMFDASGTRVYSVQFSDHRELEGFNLPFQIDIASRDDRLALRIHRYWPHAATPPSTFVLTESEM